MGYRCDGGGRLPVFVVVRSRRGGGHELAVRLKLFEKLGECQAEELVTRDSHALGKFVAGGDEVIGDGDVDVHRVSYHFGSLRRPVPPATAATSGLPCSRKSSTAFRNASFLVIPSCFANLSMAAR